MKINSLGKHSPLNSTYGLNDDWHLAIEVAEKYDCVHGLFLLIDTLLIHKKVSSLGSVLRVISTPIVNQLLGNWAPNNQVASQLFNLSSVVQHNQHLFDLYIPLTDQEAASRQLRNELQTHYMLAVLLERIPPGGNSERAWYETMRAWLLVHAMQRACHGNCQDDLLRTAADHIRLAAATMGDRLKIIQALRSPAEDFESLNNQIIFKEGRLPDRKALPPTAYDFLRSMVKVARGDHKSELGYGPYDLLYQGLASQKTAISPASVVTKLPWSQGEDDGAFELEVIDGGEDEGNIAAVPVDSDASYALQVLSSGAVLLQAVEEAQLLPWSWGRPNPFETPMLEEEVRHLVTSSNPSDQLLGVLVWLALRTGRSLRRVLSFQMSPAINPEWTIDPRSMELRRSVPMRPNGWVPSCNQEKAWVRPVAGMNRISIPQHVGDIIGKRISASPLAKWLWELWDVSWPTDPERHFRALMKERLPRLTPGMLGGVLPQQCYQGTKDEVLARMLSAHPQSGLPAACAYANWAASDPALKAFQYENDEDWLETQPIVMGSRLDPIEQHLVASVSQFTSKMKHDRARLGVVACHNFSTIYVLMMLFAATGARPVRDPFESVLHFDFEEHFVYLDDKAIETGRNARLVPLPVRLSNYIGQHYLAHLRSLGRLLQEANPSLAAEISAMAEERPSGRMPFFFLLEEENGVRWASVTGNSVLNMGLQDCPLPPNLFRQRLDKQLRRRGVDSEIITGIFGHADAGSESYGDFSTRVWAEDASDVRRALTDAFEALPFELLPIATRGVVRGWPSKSGQADTPVLFGAAAREQARRLSNLNAVRLASMEIEDFLDKRQWSQLDQDEMDVLCKRMLFYSNGLPRRNGAIRYEHLLRRIERDYASQGKKVQVGKRYIVQHPVSPFTDAAPRARALLQRARRAVEASLKSRPPSKLTITDCAVLAPVLLALECLIADKETLLQVSLGKHYRLLELMGSYYLELGNEEQTADALVVRRKITSCCAYLLARLRGGKRGVQINQVRVPDFLSPLAELLSLGQSPNAIHHSSQLIAALAGVVDQCNVMNMPGVLAGFSGGRVKSSSLSLSNWVRLEYGVPVQLPRALLAEEVMVGDRNLLENLITRPLGSALDESAGTAQGEARKLFIRLRDYLNRARDSGRDGATRSRPRLKVLVDRELKQARSKVAGAPLLLGSWVLHLLAMRKNHGYHYALSSIERYLSALSPYFAGVASKADLMAMDEGDVTELYGNILMSTKPRNRGYVGGRLLQFHAFARTLGVEDPDWDELPLENPCKYASPGVITNKEYRTALQLLLRTDRTSEYSSDSLAMLLFLCYRFGLRGREALGLMRSDWCDYKELIVVSVRNNKLRRLKSLGSRRQVPLVFNLLDTEEKLIARHFASLESLFGKDDGPVFTHKRGALTETDINRMRALVIDVLKLVTGDPRTNLHHARHTAANRLALGVFGLEGKLWKGREFSRRSDARVIVLGTSGTTRRSTWATGRYLGHVRRETQFQSYLHFVSDWADTCISPLVMPPVRPDQDMILRLDDLPRLAELESGFLENSPKRSVEPTPGKLVALLRHVAMGKPWEAASQLLTLDRASAEMMMDLVEAMARRIHLAPHPGGPGVAFLQMIKKPGWNRIMEKMEDLSRQNMSPKASVGQRFEVSRNEVASMVGASRQLIMWEEKHFRLVRQMLDYYAIPPNLYKVVVSNQADPDIYTVADNAGFHLHSQSEAGKGSYFQLDSVRRDPNTKHHVESRCVVSLQKNSVSFVRTSYELVLMFVVFFVWNQLRPDALELGQNRP